MPCGARAGRIDSSRNSERHVPRRKAGARTTSTTGNSRRGFIDQVPPVTWPLGTLRPRPAEIRRHSRCACAFLGEELGGSGTTTREHSAFASRNACARRVLWCRARDRLNVAPSASVLLEQYRWRGSPSRASMAASGADDARIDHVRRRRGPVARRWRRCARAAPSVRNILPPGPTRLVNAGIALLGARA